MKKYTIIGVVIAFIGFGFYNKIYIPKHTFKTVKVTQTNMELNINGVGEVSSKDIYKVGSIYSGKVFNLNINEGEFIKKGELIASVDTIDLKNKIEEQQATIQKLKNDIESLIIDKQSAVVVYNYQNDILKKNRKLFEQKAISELDFKKFQTDQKVAKLKIDTLNAKIKSLQNQQKQIVANLNGLNERLKRYTIYSPIDGYVVKKYISNFSIVNPNQTIVDIVNPKDVWIATHIDTRISGDVKIGNKAVIKLRSSTKPYQGYVVNIKPINNNVTYEREIDVAFKNLPIPFYLQEQATVQINVTTLKNIVRVPSKALTVYNKQEGVWVVTNNKIKFQPIKILGYNDDGIATNTIGVDTTIVIPNPKKKTLTNGMKIVVEK